MIFYFTLHPGDMTRTRIVEGAAVMVVASAFYDADRGRLRVRRPPVDHIGCLAIDSGGFTAARRWGAYPWSPAEYAAWLQEMSRDIAPAFVASMDYACERGVNREQLHTNRERIHVTHENELALREIAPEVPWLGVAQGNTVAERAYDLRRRRELGLLRSFMGIGSICGRPAAEAASVIRFYHQHLPGSTFHPFGLDARTFDRGDDIALCVRSWDSYAWNWARGGNKSGRPQHLFRREGERWGQFTRRLAEEYERKCIRPRITAPRQLPLVEVFA